MGNPEEQSVLIHLDTASLPDAVYESHDLATLEDALVAAIQPKGLGELDGNEIGPHGTTVFIYGPNANALFDGIEETLRSNPLCQNARVVIRSVGPGARSKEIRLPLHG